jgi:hypothetical protein
LEHFLFLDFLQVQLDFMVSSGFHFVSSRRFQWYGLGLNAAGDLLRSPSIFAGLLCRAFSAAGVFAWLRCSGYAWYLRYVAAVFAGSGVFRLSSPSSLTPVSAKTLLLAMAGTFSAWFLRRFPRFSPRFTRFPRFYHLHLKQGDTLD